MLGLVDQLSTEIGMLKKKTLRIHGTDIPAIFTYMSGAFFMVNVG